MEKSISITAIVVTALILAGLINLVTTHPESLKYSGKQGTNTYNPDNNLVQKVGKVQHRIVDIIDSAKLARSSQ